jgi:hypothetical protein
MSLGPLEMLVVRFPGNRFRGEIVPALTELVETGTINIVDLVFIRRDDDGSITSLGLADLDPDQANQYAPAVKDIAGLLSEDDIRELGALLEPNSSAGLMLFESAWASRFVNAVRAAHGEVLFNERIPRAVVDEVLAASGS